MQYRVEQNDHNQIVPKRLVTTPLHHLSLIFCERITRANDLTKHTHIYIHSIISQTFISLPFLSQVVDLVNSNAITVIELISHLYIYIFRVLYIRIVIQGCTIIIIIIICTN